MLLALLLLASPDALAAESRREARRELREAKRDQRELGEVIELYWRSLRWDDHVTASGFLADPGYQAEWLAAETERETRVKVQSYQILRVDLGPALEEQDRLREATLVVQVELLDTGSQVLEKSTRTQTWYKLSKGWFVEPGQERGATP